MCGGKGGGYSEEDAARDREAARAEAEAERVAAENQAQLEANNQTAATRRRRRGMSLLAGGAGRRAGQTPVSSVLAMGKPTLGGG
ncbi:hypothetical protein [Eleftheria terrae]|uniref:hypothetical protein n=1 Tax=Eleftheria terrae TaxID=1597781 RepID=UPI00263AFD46|nr:hypothetical protein [Eleftheria terrae]WKB53012.1 hypothetical protein N7L95_00995 [Eleftheria terrae]